MGFLTGFATGVFQGLDNQLAEDDNSYNKQMLQRQKAVDTVAEQWRQDKDKMQKTRNLQNSYMSQYNVPEDQAYALANDPAFEKMDPSTKPEYIKSMRPLPGKMTPATPGGPEQLVPPTKTPGTLFTPGRTIPGVSTPAYPDQPQRQVYDAQGIDPLRKTALHLLDNAHLNFVNPDGTANAAGVAQATDAFQKGDYKTVIELFSSSQKHQTSGGLGKDPIFAQTSQLVSNGTLDAADAFKYYQSAGGTNEKAADAFQLLGHKTPNQDPALQQKIDSYFEILKKQNKDPNVTDADLQLQAKKLALNAVVDINEAATGANLRIDKTKPAADAVTNLPTPGITRQQVNDSQEIMRRAPNTLTSLNRNIALLQGNPGAIGYTGELADFLGSHGVNLARLAGQEGIASAINNLTNAPDNAQYRANAKLLLATMAKPILGESKTGKDQRDLVEEIIGKHWDGSYEQIQTALHVLKEREIQNIASNLHYAENKEYAPYLTGGPGKEAAPPGRVTMPATQFRDQIMEKYHLEPEDANQVVRYITRYQPSYTPQNQAK